MLHVPLLGVSRSTVCCPPLKSGMLGTPGFVFSTLCLYRWSKYGHQKVPDVNVLNEEVSFV